MSKSEEVPVRYGIIVTAAGLMFLAVWSGANLYRMILDERKAEHRPIQHKKDNLRDNLSLYQPMPSAMVTAPLHAKEVRYLATYYKRRAYHGAPPRIPHPISEFQGQVENCLTCHKEGGFVPKYQAYTPVTPHPHFTNCVQCHVPTKVKTKFRATNWSSVQPPKLRRVPLPGGPPPIPHTLQLRQKCLTCHAGPAAVKEIKTPHPERTNCLQCHVPRRRVKPFRSTILH